MKSLPALLATALLLCPLVPIVPVAPAGAAPPYLPDLLREPTPFLFETHPLETALGNPDVVETADAWVALIHSARQTLDLEHFYCSDWPNERLRPMLEELGRAGARGVKVRWILDASMHRTYPQPADSMARLPGLELRLLDVRTLAGGVQHAKFMIVDGERVALGSANMDWRSLKHVHELGICVPHPGLAQLFTDVFDLDWELAGNPGDRTAILSAARKRYPAPVALLVRPNGDTISVTPSYSPGGWIPSPELWDLTALVRVMDSAKHELSAQVMTYGLGSKDKRDPTLDDALRRAARRGVKVRLIVSDWSLGRQDLEDLKDLAGQDGIEVRISRMPDWSGGYIPFARVEHCKFMVVDSLHTWIGTSNWEPGYWRNTRNIAITVRDRTLSRQVLRSFERSWTEVASPLREDSTYVPREHGEQTPAGRKRYGG